MEELPSFSNTSNINEKWLDNIYENIKKIENHERLAREGCESLIEYISLSSKSLGQVQFKNLSLFVTEFGLLLGDLSPILEDLDKYKKILTQIKEALKNENLFIVSHYNTSNQITRTELTPLFMETIEALYNLKVDLFREIKHILYIGGLNG